MSDPARVDKWVEQFIQVRDHLKDMEKLYNEATKPFREVKDLLEGKMRAFLVETGQENAATKFGTVHLSTRYTASLADSDAFMEFVKSHDLFDLMDRRANSTAVREYAEEHGTLPPGVNLSANETVGVRRKSGE